MARFYVTASGQAGVTSRIGSPNSGIQTHARGWHVGVSVQGRTDGDDDVFDVYATGGSAGHSPARRIGRVRLVDGVPTFEADAHA